jgi:hypothetical protein
MISAVDPRARTADGRFAPGHSGNPAGRPRGSRNRSTLFLDALREGERELIARSVIEQALCGDKVAARFCAARIEAAERARPDTITLPLEPGEALNPFIVHVRLIQAMAAGEISPFEALAAARLLAAKRNLALYDETELDDAEMKVLEPDAPWDDAETVAEAEEDEEDAPEDDTEEEPDDAEEGAESEEAEDRGAIDTDDAEAPRAALASLARLEPLLPVPRPEMAGGLFSAMSRL